MEDENRYGKQLKASRVKAGITLREAGEAAGVSAQQISKYERGVNNVRVDIFCLLLEYYSMRRKKHAGI